MGDGYEALGSYPSHNATSLEGQADPRVPAQQSELFPGGLLRWGTQQVTTAVTLRPSGGDFSADDRCPLARELKSTHWATGMIGFTFALSCRVLKSVRTYEIILSIRLFYFMYQIILKTSLFHILCSLMGVLISFCMGIAL